MKKYLNCPLCWVIIIALFTIALNFGGNCYAEDGDFKEIVTIHWSNNPLGGGTVDESYVSVPGVSSVGGGGVCSGGVSFTAPSGYKIIGFVTGSIVQTMPLYYRLEYTGAGTVVHPGVYYPLPDNTTCFYFYHTNGRTLTLEVRNVVIYLERTQNISGIGEARAAAEAAKTAAEATLQYSTDAKNAAIKAESKASEAVGLIKGLKTEFNATVAPFIKSVKSINNATATKNDNFTVLISALNATQYRAGVNGNFTAWQSSPQVDVPLPTVGVNTIEVQARRSDAQDAPIANDYITVFKLN